MKHFGRKGLFAALIALLLIAVLLPLGKPAEADSAYLKVCGTYINLSTDGTYLNDQVRFDAQNCTLYLNDVDFETDGMCIEGSDIFLTIRGSGSLRSHYCGAIEVYGYSSLQLDGTFRCESDLSEGVYVSGPMSVAGGCFATSSGISAGMLGVASDLSIVYPQNGSAEDILENHPSEILIKAPGDYPLEVAATAITDANCHDILNDGGSVSFRYIPFGGSILTLNNADIDAFGSYMNVAWSVTANIFCNEPGYGLTINLIGDNKLSGASYAIDFAPTDYNGKVTLTGPGKLTMDSEKYGIVVYGELTLKDTTVTANKSCYAKRSFSIDNCACTVDVNDNYSYGLYTEQSLNIKDSLVTITTGEHSVIVDDTLNISGNSTFSVTSVISSALQVVNDVNLSGRIALLEPEGGVFVDTLLYESDGTTLASKAVYTSVYNIFVGSEQVTGLHTDGEGWAFTPAEGDDPAVLALNNYSYTGKGVTINLKADDAAEDYLAAAVVNYREEAPLRIEITGENTLILTDTDELRQAIAVLGGGTTEDALTIVGMDEGASLTAKADSAITLSSAISSRGGLAIQNLTVNAETAGTAAYHYGIYAESELLLDHCDTQVIGSAASDSSYGIYARTGDVIIDGGKAAVTSGAAPFSIGVDSGRADISVSDCELTVQSGEATDSGYGMYSGQNTRISNSSVQVTSGQTGFRSDGIYANGHITIENGSEITANPGGGLYSYGVISIGDGVTIKDSTVQANGGASVYQSGGVYATTDILIDGSTIIAIGAETTDAYGSGSGIISFGSTEIKDSDVTAIAAAGFESYGVCAYDWDNSGDPRSLTVEDSKLIAAGVDAAYGNGIFVNKLIVRGNSEITANSGTTAGAIVATSQFDLSDNLAIVTPFNGAYRRNENGMITVFADGQTPAGTVEIKSAATVSFTNEDGTVLQSGKVAIGDMPAYYGETPVKESTAHYEYTFVEWTPAFVPVTEDAVYTAVYEESILRPKFAAENVAAYDSWVMENGELLYRYDITVTDLIDGALSISSAQVFLTYDHDAIALVKGEGPVDWLFSDKDDKLFAAWASDTAVPLKNGDILMTLYFANIGAAPDTRVEIGFTVNAQEIGSALSFVDADGMTELFAHTVDGSILFDTLLIGDANCDGQITGADAALILRSIVGLSGLTPRGVLQADTDCDGEVTAADAVLILRYIIGLVASLPVEPA